MSAKSIDEQKAEWIENALKSGQLVFDVEDFART